MHTVETPFYVLRINAAGLLSLWAKQGARQLEVMDRGALHETLDMARWGKYANADILRAHDHHIQLYRDAVVVAEGAQVRVTGELETEAGRAGILAFETLVEWREDSPNILLRVRRHYLKTCVVGDDSLCFLAPMGFAKEFHMHTADGAAVYQTRDGDSFWGDFQDEIVGPYASVAVPRRLKAAMRTSGWGAVLGKHGGFVIVLLEYGPGTSGEMRCTRPRSAAFDELEFQWMAGGPREKGLLETGCFLVAPCAHAAEADVLYTTVTGGTVCAGS